MAAGAKNLFAVRMKERRLELGLSQRELGIAAGIDEGVASTRINRYELGVHSPDPLSAARIAAALAIPLAALFCEDSQLHRVIKLYATADQQTRDAVETLLASSSSEG